MQELLPFFQSINLTYWGDYFFRYAFYASLLIIVFMVKNKPAKAIYANYPIILLTLIYSPIGYQISNYFFYGIWQYYCRLYSMIPVLYSIAFGIILLLDKIKGIVKLGAVASICAFIVFNGSYVYNQPWMKKAENLEKVPSAIVHISKFMHEYDEDKTINIVFPSTLSTYSRQYDASFITPYTRLDGYETTLSKQLISDKQDVSLILLEAGDAGCDYVVTFDWPIIREKWANNGYTQIFNVRGYDVYDIHKNVKKEISLNDLRQIVKIEYVDENGNPRLVDTGLSRIMYEYDSYGHEIRRSYADPDGILVNTSSGYAIVESAFEKWKYTGQKLYNNEGIEL